ncbi:MAG: indole-3-glycerol phosphate synthase TrpC [Eubacterium sp.]|nr:indole-3-glycerol phosphate synthase TrpC [Eubacterium sp.]
MNILDEIAKRTGDRIASSKIRAPLSQIRDKAESLKKIGDFPFEKALKAKDISFICEIKKASPSKGVISEDFPYVQIAKDYEDAGASCISVLTEPYFFQGSDSYLIEIAKTTSIPILRKDFIVDEYMIYESKILGASAILLILAILEESRISEYLQIAHSLGLSALVETHDEREVESALNAGARVIGINNRNLKTFEVDINTSIRLRPLVPKQKIFVCESGIKTNEDIEKLREISADAVLIGETLMRSGEKKLELARLRGEKND